MITVGETPDAREARESSLRGMLLRHAHFALTNQHGGWVTGKGMLRAYGSALGGDQPDNHNHHLQLLRELVANAYLLEEDNREDESQPFGIDYLTYKITGKGV
ncbi:MAG: hypothetical protein AAF797_17565, partial [Planctomycetota bacterium]